MPTSFRRKSSLGGSSTTSGDALFGQAPDRDSLEADRAMAAVAARLFDSLGDPAIRRLGRFELRERVGQGGMGFVYAGWDPDLDRTVAIKVVRPNVIEDGGADRLLEEARTLAKIQHPNVVTVLDAGREGDRVWLAMEFIPTALDAWLETRPAPAEILEAFCQAGRGLMAAHEAGLVHRDFKPSNVLRRDDASVAVADFGLARLVSAGPAAGRAGTLFFMSPEQLSGEPIDARSDQYSWCVALYSALHGEHPYVAQSVTDKGARTRPKRSEFRTLSPRIDAVLERGLSENPTSRFPDMEALLFALEPSRKRWRWLGVGALATVASTVLLIAPESRVSPCAVASSQLDAIWTPARREAVAQRFEASNSPLAADTTVAVSSALRRYATSWTGERARTCEATLAVHDAAASAVLERRAVCLDGRVSHFEALVDGLLEADAKAVQRATHAVDQLPSVARCSDDDALRRAVALPEDPAIAGRIEVLNAQLARAHTRHRLGHYQEAATLAAQARADAASIDYAPLTAWAQRVEGRALHALGEHRRSAVLIEEAGLLSRAVGDDEGALEAARILTRHRAEFEPFSTAGVDWERLGGAMLKRLGSPPEVALQWHQAEAAAKSRRQDLDGALAAVVRAESFADSGAPPDSPRRGSLAATRGAVLMRLGRFEEALGSFERARTVYAATLGVSHPAYAEVVQNIGAAHISRGDQAKGRPYLAEALGTMESLLGEDSTRLADYYYNLAVADVDLGQLDIAEREMTRAQQMYAKELGAEHPYVASAHEELGRIDFARKDYDAAREHYERARTIKEAALGPDNPELILTLRGLGRLALATGRRREGFELYARVSVITEKTYGPTSDRTADASVKLSSAARAVNDLPRARAEAAKAVAILENLDHVAPEWLADARFVLAQATRPIDSEKARALAELAREAYRPGERRTEIERWLAGDSAAED